MDKNFIKVDDLFRQRLGGGEEREQSGAWLNMRELLDKEMPQQRRIGIFYWRRLFSAVAVLSLVGTVCIGSYEISSAFRSRSTADVSLSSPTATNNEPGGAYELSSSEGMSREEAKAAARSNGHIHAHISSNKQRHIAPSNAMPEVQANAARIAGKTNTDGQITVDGNVNSNTKKAISNTGVIRRNNHINNSNNNTDEVKNVTTRNSGTSKRIAHYNIDGAVKPAANEAATGNDVAAKQTTADKTGVTTTAVAATKSAEQKIANAHSKKQQAARSRITPATGIAAATSGTSSAVANNEHNNSGKVPANSDKKDDKLVLNSNASNTGSLPAGDKLKNSKATPATATPSVAGTISSSKSNTPATTNNTADKGTTTTSNNIAAAVAAKKDMASAVAANNGPEVATTSANGAVATTTPPIKNGSNDNGGQSKRVITKLLVHQRNIKVAENEYTIKEDTISMEKVNMDLGLKQATASNATATNEAVPAKSRRRARHTGGAHSASSGNSNGLSNLGATPGTATVSAGGAKAARQGNQAGGATKPGASASNGTSASLAASQPGGEVAEGANENATASTADPVVAASGAEVASENSEMKPKAAAKKGSGVSLIQKLSMAFNDVKDNAAKTKFAVGLTAGINSNFFGPASFKGFQFGLTGDIIFNDSWNVMTELKYFHRLNNNSSIEDNYYTYTPVGSQYRKDLQLNSYSFSALHSLEMPVAVRYHKGNFNFYAGGNFLYTFSINTGAFTVPAPGAAPEFVNAPGPDNAPTFKEEDFSSRFGLGYLFGFSYDVAPNLSLDLRNVQTVWDNAATTGAKSISGQLYKTPSLQLSIMYRLGGNRHKD